MKKTEKIEIRLSHEDKERLNKIAEREGRTISQIVRGLIDKYMDLNSARDAIRPSKKSLWLTGIFSGLVGLILGGTLTFLTPKEDQSATVKTKTTAINYDGGNGTRFSIPLVDGYETNQSIEMGEKGTVDHIVTVKSKGHDMYNVSFTACVQTKDICSETLNTDLDVNWVSPSRKVVHDSLGNKISIDLY